MTRQRNGDGPARQRVGRRFGLRNGQPRIAGGVDDRIAERGRLGRFLVGGGGGVDGGFGGAGVGRGRRVARPRPTPALGREEAQRGDDDERLDAEDDDGRHLETDVVDQEAGAGARHEAAGAAQRRPQTGHQAVRARVVRISGVAARLFYGSPSIYADSQRFPLSGCP